MRLDRRAIAVDPLSASAYFSLGIHAYHAGQADEANRDIQKTLDLNPEANGAHLMLALIYLDRRNTLQALAEVQQEREPVSRLQGQTLAYAALKRNDESKAALQEMIDRFQAGGAFQIAQTYGFLGDTELACEWLERAYVQHDLGLPFLKEEPAFKQLEGKPRYTALIRKLRLPA
jgi:tetratricopeptide (TPR) repeat protein